MIAAAFNLLGWAIIVSGGIFAAMVIWDELLDNWTAIRAALMGQPRGD